MTGTCWYPWQQLYRVPNSKPIQKHFIVIKKLIRRTAPPCWPYLVPETWVVKPFQELLSHDHGAGEEGPVGQQEVLDVGRIHHRVLLHQVHGETLRRALIIQNEDRSLQVDRAKLEHLQKFDGRGVTLMTICPFLVPVRSSSRCSFTMTISPSSSTFCMFFSTWLRMQQ